jgi:hypothetical protein
MVRRSKGSIWPSIRLGYDPGMAFLAPLFALAAAAQQPGDFRREEESDLLAFSYSWPAVVGTEPALREQLRREMESERRRAIEIAERWRAEIRRNGLEFQPHYFAQTWSVAGATPLLLSVASRETFAGGAHGNLQFAAILWDRAADRSLTAAEAVGAAALGGMRERYCAALNDERAERRGEPVRPDPDDQFSQCPPLADQVLVPKDSDGNGLFDVLEVQLAPYAAGPYAEGAYFALVSFTAADVAALAEGYRAAFEAAGERSPHAPQARSGSCPETEMELPPGSICIGRVTDRYIFAFAFPPESARVPGLEAMLRAEAEAREQWMRRESDTAALERAESGAEPMRFTYAEGWTIDLLRPEIAAASGHAQAYTGGAHGGIAFHSILLDPRTGRRLALADLFADPAAGPAAVQASFCPALLAEVRTRRGSDGEPVECPAATEHPVTPVAQEDGRASAMMALLDPYVVGSWAEGPYDVTFPVTAQMLAALKPEYREAFALPPD